MRQGIRTTADFTHQTQSTRLHKRGWVERVDHQTVAGRASPWGHPNTYRNLANECLHDTFPVRVNKLKETLSPAALPLDPIALNFSPRGLRVMAGDGLFAHISYPDREA